MKKILLTLALLLPLSLLAQEYKWENVPMDGSRTAAVKAGETKVKPNSSAAKVMKLVEDAQPAMARVKEVVGFSKEALYKGYPESPLSNWTVDTIMEKVEELAGKKVHVGFANFGGIRVDMPKGDIILDDMLSMFPFKNQLVYVEHTGKQIRAILENMAADRFEVLGGVRVVADKGKLVSAEIAGEPIDDDKVYGVATISFLLDGGDGLTLKENAVSVTSFPEVDVIDAVLEYVYAETAAGRPIEYKVDGRVKVNDYKKKRK